MEEMARAGGAGLARLLAPSNFQENRHVWQSFQRLEHQSTVVYLLGLMITPVIGARTELKTMQKVICRTSRKDKRVVAGLGRSLGSVAFACADVSCGSSGLGSGLCINSHHLCHHVALNRRTKGSAVIPGEPREVMPRAVRPRSSSTKENLHNRHRRKASEHGLESILFVSEAPHRVPLLDLRDGESVDVKETPTEMVSETGR
jgi:hypothetical protein